MSPKISLRIDETSYRRLTIRFRTRVGGSATELERLENERHLGLPEADAMPFKREIDVLVEGSAYPARSGDFEGTLRLRTGPLDRSMHVSGPRRIVRHRGRLRIEAPGELSRVALEASNAYGGGPRAQRYPRNPFGKGYCVAEDLAEGLELPQLEEPDDLLTSERVLSDPALWWKQPRPALWGPTPLIAFPRCVYAGGMLPVPEAPRGDELPEFADGDLEASAESAIDWRLAQEMPRRARLAGLPAGTDIVLEGCLPLGQSRRWKAPPPQVIEVSIDGHTARHEAVMQTLRLRPEQDALSISYSLELTLPRAFVPGIHARIPIRASALGESTEYATPEPLLRRLRERSP